MKTLPAILTSLALAALTVPAGAVTVPVAADTSGSVAAKTIPKAAGAKPGLPVSARSEAFLFFDVSSTGLSSANVAEARLILYFTSVAKAGNLGIAVNTSAFQEKFTTATIPSPTFSAAGGIPLTTASAKSYVVVGGLGDLLRNWLDNPGANFGLALTGDATVSAVLASKETSLGISATLEVDLKPTGDIAPATITSSGAITAGSFTTSGALSSGSVFTGSLNGTSLAVNGTAAASRMLLSNDIIAGGPITGQSLNTTGGITAEGNITSSSGTLHAVSGNVLAGGRIGIGTTTPTSALDIRTTSINPQITLSNTATSGGFGSLSGVNAVSGLHSWYMGTAANGNFSIISNTTSTTALTVGSAAPFAGLVAIGTPNPVLGFKLTVGGGVLADFFTPSDLRFKKEIEPLSQALAKVQKLRGVSYAMRRDEFPERNFDDRRHLGFIAQEIREILPEVVKEMGEGQLSVEYTAVIPVLVTALQELEAGKDAEIAALQARISRLEAAVGERPAQTTTASLNRAE